MLNRSSASGKALRVLEDVLDVRLGRSAAVVADPVEAHRVPELGIRGLDGEHDLAVQVVRERDVGRRDPEPDHLPPADTAPAEGLGRQLHLVGAGPVEDVADVTVVRQHVRQGRRVAERVHVVADLRAHPETVAEVALAVGDLTVQAHHRREVDVGLDVLAAGDVPPAALDQPPRPLEELGVDPLDLLEEPGLPAGEDELRVLVAAVRRGPERGQRLVYPGLPGPQPHRVDVGVAYHVDDHGKFIPLRLLCTCSLLTVRRSEPCWTSP